MPLTDAALRKRLGKPGAKGASPYLSDTGTGGRSGLVARINSRGKITFVLLGVRFPGSDHPTKALLGEYPAMTIEQARAAADDWRIRIRQGIDPRQDKAVAAAAARQAEEAAERERGRTFAAVAADFERKVLVGDDPKNPKQRTGPTTAREIAKHFTALWADRPIDSITRSDILGVVKRMVGEGKAANAHNMLGHVRRLFTWAIAQDEYGIEQSPVWNVKPKLVIGSKVHRARVLTDDELRALWAAAGKLGYPYGPLVRLLALTGQRRNEIGDAAWSEIDKAKSLLTIPASRMKAKRTHVLPLPRDAVAILDELPRFEMGGDFLFSTTHGRRPVSGYSKAKLTLNTLMLAELRRLAQERGEDPARVKLEPFVLHDIRRTMRTGLSALPIPDLVRELTIAHSKPGLHQVYDQHAYLDEKRDALERWAARLMGIVEPRSSNVVQLSVRA